ncbi:MAG: hypothetical protein JWL75_417 [Parcubacteria group bacterium]|nr:hypothetical protein [Parcubacteria group bacterium]
MSVVRTVGKGIAWNAFGSSIGKIIVLGNIFIILHHLSVYDYGLSELVFSVITTASIVLLPGLATAIQADISHALASGAPGDARAIFDKYFLLNLFLGTCLCIGLFALATPISILVKNVSIAYFLRIVSFSFILSPLRMAGTMLAQVSLRFADQSLYSVVEEAAKGIVLAIMFFGLGRGIDGLLYAAVLSQAVVFLLFLPRTISAYAKFGNEKPSQPFRYVDLIRKHRKWSVTNSYISNLTQSTQLWLIRILLGTEAVGLYAVASGIVSQISAFLPLGTVLSPIAPAYVEKPVEMGRLIRASLKLQFVLSLVLCLAAWAALPIFVHLFPKYAHASPLAAGMILSVIPLGFANVLTPIYSAYKEQFAFLISVTIKFILVLILFPVGIQVFGLYGIAIATIITSAVTAIERYLRLRRITPQIKMRFKDLYTLSTEERIYIRVLILRIRAFRIFQRTPKV